MQREEGQRILDKGMNVLWIVWFAFLLSLFVYVCIAHLLGDEFKQNANLDLPLPLLRNIFISLGIIILISNHYLRKMRLSKPLMGPSSTDPYENPSASDLSMKMNRYSVVTVMSLGLCESIGILGLVSFFSGGRLQTLYAFICVSAAAMIVYRPKREEIMR